MDARLVYRSAESTGILEVCNELGEWSIVCADVGVSPDGAGVACSQLGYGDLSLAPYISVEQFNRDLNDGSRPTNFLLSETGLFCFGNESHLSECQVPPQEPTPTPPGVRRKRIVEPLPPQCGTVARIGCNCECFTYFCT